MRNREIARPTRRYARRRYVRRVGTYGTADRSPAWRDVKYNFNAQARLQGPTLNPRNSENVNRRYFTRPTIRYVRSHIDDTVRAIRHAEFCFIGLDIPGISAALLFHEYNSGISSSNINASSRLDRTSANNFPEFRGRRSFAVVSPLNTNIGRTAAHHPPLPSVPLAELRAKGGRTGATTMIQRYLWGVESCPRQKRGEERMARGRGGERHRAVE